MHHGIPKTALFAVLLTLTAYAVSVSAISPLMTTIARDFNAPFTDFGFVYMLLFFSFAVASLAGGKAAQRLGLSIRFLVICGIFGAGTLLAFAGLLPAMIWFCAWIIPFGFAGGMTETFGTIMLVEFGKADSSKLLNLSQVFFCAGTVGTPYLVSLLLANAVVLFIGLVFTLLTRRIASGEGRPAAETKTAEPPPDGSESPGLLNDGLFWLLLVALFIYVTVECAAAVWIPPYFEKYLLVSKVSAAWRPAVFWLGVGLGRGLMVILPTRWTLWPALVSAVTAMIAAAALLSGRWSPEVTTYCMMLFGFAAGPVWPIIVSISHHARKSSVFTSGVIAAGAAGAGVGPWLSSLILKYMSWKWFFPILTVGCVALLAVICTARKHAAGKTKSSGKEAR